LACTPVATYTSVFPSRQRTISDGRTLRLHPWMSASATAVSTTVAEPSISEVSSSTTQFSGGTAAVVSPAAEKSATVSAENEAVVSAAACRVAESTEAPSATSPTKPSSPSRPTPATIPTIIPVPEPRRGGGAAGPPHCTGGGGGGGAAGAAYDGDASGKPQCGHCVAEVLTEPRHSGHGIRGMMEGPADGPGACGASGCAARGKEGRSGR